MKDIMYDPSRISQTRSPASFIAKNSSARSAKCVEAAAMSAIALEMSAANMACEVATRWEPRNKNTELVTAKRFAPFFVLQPWSGTELPGRDNFAHLMFVCACWLQYNKAVQQHDLWCCSRHDFVCVSQASMCLCRHVQVFWPSIQVYPLAEIMHL